MKTKAIFATLLATLFVFGDAWAEDCSIGDCYLVREAVRERNEMLEEARWQNDDAVVLRERRSRQEEEQLRLAAAEARNREAKSAPIALAAATEKTSKPAPTVKPSPRAKTAAKAKPVATRPPA